MHSRTFEDVAVVGMYHRDREGVPATAIVASLMEGTELDFERDYHNEFDNYAIKILYQSNHIGFVEAASACYISPWLDQGVKYTCVIDRFEQRKSNLHPIVRFVPFAEQGNDREAADEASIEL